MVKSENVHHNWGISLQRPVHVYIYRTRDPALSTVFTSLVVEKKKKKMERKEVKIFGVRLLIEEEEVMRKSKSMGNLSHAPENVSPDNGYLSDGLGGRGGRERKRGWLFF